MSWISIDTFRMFIPLLTIPRKNTPSSVRTTEPLPPVMLVPVGRKNQIWSFRLMKPGDKLSP